MFFPKKLCYCNNNNNNRINSGKLKTAKWTSALEKIARTFRMARIDPSRQGVMTQAIFVRGEIRFWSQNEEKGQKRLQITKNPIPPTVHRLFFL